MVLNNVVGDVDVVDIKVGIQRNSVVVFHDRKSDRPLGVLEASSTSEDDCLLVISGVESYSLNLKRAFAVIVEEELVGTERAEAMAKRDALAIGLADGIVRRLSIQSKHECSGLNTQPSLSFPLQRRLPSQTEMSA